MTVANIYFTASRAWVVTDTLMCRGRDMLPLSFGSKVHIVPHLNLVHCGRGSVELAHKINVQLYECYHPAGLEEVIGEVADALPAMHELGRRAHLEACAKLGVPTANLRQALYVIGYDAGERRFRAWLFLDEHGFKPEELEPGTYLEPGFGVEVPRKLPDVERSMVKLACLQKEMMEENDRRNGGGVGIGGELVMVEMRPAAMTVRKFFKFPDYAEAARRIEEGEGEHATA